MLNNHNKNEDIFANWIDADPVISKSKNGRIKKPTNIIVEHQTKQLSKISNQKVKTKIVANKDFINNNFINYGDYYLQLNYELNNRHENYLDDFRDKVEKIYFNERDIKIDEKNKNRQAMSRKRVDRFEE